MNRPLTHAVNKAVDGIQERLTNYACELNYEALPPQAIHAAKARIISNLGALIHGYFSESCQIARNLAALMPDASGATVIGTRMKTTPDLAAFVNGTTARYAELTDSYLGREAIDYHPSDTVAPVLAAAEYAQVSGRDLITCIVLAYEVYMRIADVFYNPNMDTTNLTCLATAVAAGKLMGLSADQLAHCISMAAVPNVILRQVRLGQRSMFKAAASGHAGRAGVFAALLARAGMEGPHLPFEGKAGWCENVARERLSLNALGTNGTHFKILDTRIKPRPAARELLAPILAAEKIAPLKNIREVKQVIVEVHKHIKDIVGTGEHHWHPHSRETADQSAPFLVAATLMDGTVTLRSYNGAHLRNPELQTLMQKTEIVVNEEFTQPYELSRVTVVTQSGERLVGEGGGEFDLSEQKSDAQVGDRFRGLAEDVFSTHQMNVILERLWHLEDLGNVAEIPPAFVLA